MRAFIIIVSLMLLPSQVLARECAMKQPTQINVQPIAKEVQFDTSQTLSQIQGQSSSLNNPYGFHRSTITQGFMKGVIKVVPSVKLGGFSIPSQNKVCLWYDEINITIEVDPKIILAKEVYQNLCTRRSVTKHEMKHVEADRRAVNKFSRRVGQRVHQDLERRGFKVGYIPISQKEQAIKRMQRVVFDIVQDEYKRLETDRAKEQKAIDTLEEYERVSAECPDSQRLIQKRWKR